MYTLSNSLISQSKLCKKKYEANLLIIIRQKSFSHCIPYPYGIQPQDLFIPRLPQCSFTLCPYSTGSRLHVSRIPQGFYLLHLLQSRGGSCGMPSCWGRQGQTGADRGRTGADRGRPGVEQSLSEKATPGNRVV